MIRQFCIGGIVGLAYAIICDELKISTMKQCLGLAIGTGLLFVATLACYLLHFARAHGTMGKGD